MKIMLFTMFFIVLLSFPAALLVHPAFAEVNMEEFVSFNNPVGLAWINGSFIVSSTNGDTHLLKISRDGQTIEPFAPIFSGEGEVYIAISPGKAGFPEGYLYVSSGNSIYEIDPSGNEVRLFSKPYEEMGLGHIAFDTVGTWGNLLYAVNYNGLLWSIDSDGNANLVVDLGNDLLPESIDFAPLDFGDFGGDMLIALEMGRKVIAMSDEDPGQATILIEFDDESPERVLVIPAESDLYIAKKDENLVVKIASGYFSSHQGGLVVITEGEYGEHGSITILEADGKVIVITKIAENLENPHFEGAVFVNPTVFETVTAVTTVQDFDQTSILVLGISIVAVVALAVVLIRGQRYSKE
ncbi:MAG: hypothetical protein QF812_01340 [Nitrososphaerales archaeon]|jgi:hypothetical protein|nr:hypothetical protein [Nitrososphaerales archaeon]